MPAVTNTAIPLRKFIPDITTQALSYNRLRWFRAPSEAGPYEAVTGPAAAGAALTTPRSEPYNIVGLGLTFRLNGTTDVSLTFTGSGTLSAAQVASQLDAATDDATPTTSAGKVVLTTVQTGTVASIEITGGDAAPFLGFLEGAVALGVAADTVLTTAHEYTLTDSNSAETYWYTTRFVSSTSSVESLPSVPFPAALRPKVPASQTVMCFLRLADMQGNALPDRKVLFAAAGHPNRAGAELEWGVGRQYVESKTDANGYLEIRLLRGMLLDFSIDGLGFTRRITTPTTGDSVDLLDPALVAEDEYGIQEPQIESAFRLS